MAILKLEVASARDASTLARDFQTATGPRSIINRIVKFVEGLSTGTEGPHSTTVPPQVVVKVQDNEVQASGTITFSGVSTAADTVLINGKTFTCNASPSGDQWAPGSTATDSATNLAAAINASATSLVSGYVTASNVAGVLTVTSAFYGTSGNQCTIAKGVDGGSVMTVSGARLTSGAADPGLLTLQF
jgi:phage tail sheath gpL-like